MNSLFQPPGFLDRTNIYEVNIRQYTPEGTFKSFAAHLPRLKDMGIEIIWLMPIHPIGAVNRKGVLGSYYSIRDYKAVNPEFGSDADLHALIDQCHASGFRVIIDWVANHTAWDHHWALTNPEFFLRDECGKFKVPFDWEDVIQIDHTNISQQKEMTDAMLYWIKEFDLDGFRCDMAHLVPLQFWIDSRNILSAYKKDLIWLAETDDLNYHRAFDVSYAWPWMHKAKESAEGKLTLPVLRSVLDEPARSRAAQMFFTTNHDENSWQGTEYEKYDRYAKALAVFSCTYNSIPLIYSGQELPNRKRLAFFEKDQIAWTDQPVLHQFYKTLCNFRKTNSAVSGFHKSELFFFEEALQNGLLAWFAERGDDRQFTILNLGKEPSHYNFHHQKLRGNFTDIFSLSQHDLTGNFEWNSIPGDYIVLSSLK